ncbi:hypothetical protein A2631_05100 [Candidatus Daviesbacteria bacterium RIFCSPHIGHO2_01_FULL_44_29]|uniref:ABC transporter substrate-binding protein n=1 Tax=Candidatus Daviesbacteria bacterium RIFCSPHIGHO2_02_FULL_43_12 TaxID=1797776 RepID=A0A1F5KGT9_9BACT|nr:MAG: hypothetical protein A2631_05100 [Candidatus Daviesbacteria bacterium RIFCSPHIGHO2_01_FULL_44_29]OGE40098.1 MAG: hypothetical protein A3D25_04830 [Candidatus Daviesbacteria bacterium RIFCSPHIGHO2_02_FULL_43_12]OGE41046.1 MAG: hypothetical protein A3E86_04925 [Candidatus Daviesbacteria bacterium RIFCSPHIGHO2_12_FULL_47_45]OGE70222.1 MAG: hypothetical protein A3B55_00740 [Candidatus Daviesbacteria bacterium RIFCSPLOWO2_01_FULL_43_15]
MQRLVMIMMALLIVGAVAFWKFAPNFWSPPKAPAAPQPVELAVWGLFEEEANFRVIAENYQRTHPNIKIVYTKANLLNYRPRVQTKILNKEGPDVFMLHNTWVPMFQKTLALQEAPATVFSVTDYAQIFYPVAKDSFIQNNKIYAVPASINGLALFVNTDILRAANVDIPQTWDQFLTSAVKMTVKDDRGNIQTAGAAIGTTENIEYWSDILGLLFFQQPGADLNKPNTPEAVDILKFYTNFVHDPRQKVWDASVGSAGQAFYSGRLAYYFAPSTKINDIKLANPQLHFQIAPVPQLPGGNVGWGTFWGYAVSSTSPHSKEAWDFIKYLSSRDVETILFQKNQEAGLVPEPYARFELQSSLSNDPLLAPIVNLATSFKSWYLSSKTMDQGVNDEMIKLFATAVNSVNSGGDPQRALNVVEEGRAAILDKYVNNPPQPTK